MSDTRKTTITNAIELGHSSARSAAHHALKMRLETIAVRAGAEIDPTTGALAPPLHLSTTFEHGPAAEAIHGFIYVRQKNPTQSRLEAALRDLESGVAALVFSSGMAAGAAILQSLPPDSHVIFSDDIYTDVRSLARDFLPLWHIESSTMDLQDLQALKHAIRPNTRLIWIETPSNPLLKILDIAGIAEVAHQTGAQLLVDNTFATPILQRPLLLGADVVLHSTTKYCGGHSDVQGGCLVVKSRELLDKLFQVREILGAVASPFNSWLILRGLRTLPCRVERHSANAAAVAAALAASPAVEAVYYPGLVSHRGHEIACRQMRSFGGMLSFLVRGDRDEALGVTSRVKLFVNATSLGGVESLIEHRASNEGKSSNAPQNLLRLSVGLEHPDDLIEDLLQALA
ncbi:MAG TPA: aminotransferase class V-fold PLP-dependent enzyme [Candidatus Acidoferrum sp.]|jgi:cystathionine gamma-synthase|nr:aminotransferase class V-fold PLP-dependent enzyme [Candidatus Acidoferrum sp.]